MKVTAQWVQDLQFTGESHSQAKIPLNSRPAQGEETSPMNLVALALAGCTGMDTISILQKKRQEVTEFVVSVTGEQEAEHPRVFKKLHIEYVITGKNIKPAAVDRSIELSMEKYCPVVAMLDASTEITHSSKIIELETA